MSSTTNATKTDSTPTPRTPEMAGLQRSTRSTTPPPRTPGTAALQHSTKSTTPLPLDCCPSRAPKAASEPAQSTPAPQAFAALLAVMPWAGVIDRAATAISDPTSSAAQVLATVNPDAKSQAARECRALARALEAIARTLDAKSATDSSTR